MGFAITEHYCSASGESGFYWSPTFTHDCEEKKQAETTCCKEEQNTEICCKKTEKETQNNCFLSADIDCCSIDDSLIRVTSSFSSSKVITIFFPLAVISFYSIGKTYSTVSFLEYKTLTHLFLVKRDQQSFLSTFRI